MLRIEPRGVAPGDGTGCVVAGGCGAGVGALGAMRKGGVPKLDPIGAAKAESEVTAIMSIRIINIS